jgi:hypothetical protein
MHLYTCIWVVQLVSRLNLAFLSLKLSRGIDIMLVCLCLCGFNNPRNTLRWKLLQLASVRLQIILFGLRTANKNQNTIQTNQQISYQPDIDSPLNIVYLIWQSKPLLKPKHTTTMLYIFLFFLISVYGRPYLDKGNMRYWPRNRDYA